MTTVGRSGTLPLFETEDALSVGVVFCRQLGQVKGRHIGFLVHLTFTRFVVQDPLDLAGSIRFTGQQAFFLVS